MVILIILQRLYGFNKILFVKTSVFIDNLSFKLTLDQDKAVKDILSDLESSKRMNRLLQGDVGSGKTIVAIISMYMNYCTGNLNDVITDYTKTIIRNGINSNSWI